MMPPLIEEVAIDHNGWARLAVIQNGECVISLHIVQGDSASPYATVQIENWAELNPEVAAAIGRTFMQWSVVAHARGVTL